MLSYPWRGPPLPLGIAAATGDAKRTHPRNRPAATMDGMRDGRNMKIVRESSARRTREITELVYALDVRTDAVRRHVDGQDRTFFDRANDGSPHREHRPNTQRGSIDGWAMPWSDTTHYIHLGSLTPFPSVLPSNLPIDESTF